MSCRPILTGLAAGVLLLAGCGGDPEPKFADPTSETPTFSTSPSESASPTKPTSSPTPTEPVEPVYPKAARGEGKAAAVSFARYFFAMVDYASNTGDLSGLRSLAAPECQACVSGGDYIQGVYASGGRIEGLAQSVKLVSADQFGSTNGNGWIVTVDAKASPHIEFRKSGKKKRWPGGQDRIELTLSRTGPADIPWLASDYRPVS